VFELTPPSAPGGVWTEAVIYSFSGVDGATPLAPVIFDQSGNLYGTTSDGGSYTGGTVFRLMPPSQVGGVWTQTVLHSFEGKRGFGPEAGLEFGQDGSLFGTTFYGGANGEGTAFQLSPGPGGTWTFAILHDFPVSPQDGFFPAASLTVGGQNILYGTTSGGGGGGGGGGTIFSLTISGGHVTESILWTFKGIAKPLAGVTIYKGVLYGTTSVDGNGNGTVYRLTP
jgi:uncharacterized repeat protein (TIGR03803 family)